VIVPGAFSLPIIIAAQQEVVHRYRFYLANVNKHKPELSAIPRSVPFS
jgi:hypothetical protein